jgi:erythromycin esterase-like protein
VRRLPPQRSSGRAFKQVLAFAALAAGACAVADRDGAAAAEASAQTSGRAAWAEAAVPLTGSPNDYDSLLGAIGDGRFVLLGESTHGTEEYYRERARISERLVRERGFGAVLIEGDWSPTLRVNRYVRGLGSDRNANQALAGYTAFPQWMWPNTAFRDFIERLRVHNLTLPAERRVGVYGMDVYDVFEAQEAAIAYLSRANPAAAARARASYRCFAPYNRSTSRYGEAARRAGQSCREEAGAVLAEVRRIPRPEGAAEAEEHFAAVRAAASVAAGEEYFRTAYAGSMAWNARDRHMARNLEETAQHVGRLRGGAGKVVVWAHNSHNGDARATYAANRGELNLGQLVRLRFGQDSFLVGFLTHAGRVRAAPEWDRPSRVYDLSPALPGSDADVLRQAALPAFSLVLRGKRAAEGEFGRERLQRAVGVVYAPATERQSHYFEARLARQFDAVVFFQRSNPVTPIR